MDGPNVNLKFFKEFAADFKEDNFCSLVGIGSLHIGHSAFKTGPEKLEWGLKKFLKLLIPSSTTHQVAGRTMRVSLDLQSIY